MLYVSFSFICSVGCVAEFNIICHYCCCCCCCCFFAVACCCCCCSSPFVDPRADGEHQQLYTRVQSDWRSRILSVRDGRSVRRKGRGPRGEVFGETEGDVLFFAGKCLVCKMHLWTTGKRENAVPRPRHPKRSLCLFNPSWCTEAGSLANKRWYRSSHCTTAHRGRLAFPNISPGSIFVAIFFGTPPKNSTSL